MYVYAFCKRTSIDKFHIRAEDAIAVSKQIIIEWGINRIIAE